MADTTMTKAKAAEAQVERTSQAPTYQPRFDIMENDDELTLYGDLPGVEESQLDIRYENEQLTIQGAVPPRFQGIQLSRREYGVGDFYRVFAIGASIDTEKITAEIRNGVLVVHLPKTEGFKPKRIAVKAG